MISKSLAKFIKSLQIKKHRYAERMFIVEGLKSVQELLESDFQVVYVVYTNKYAELFSDFIGESFEVNQNLLEQIGTFKSNDAVLAVARMKESLFSGFSRSGYTLVLDSINDPGNLGTILRVADWYGIKQIIANRDTVDLYSPKVIAASKGSFTRVDFFVCNLIEELKNTEVPIYAAAMNGTSSHKFDFTENGILIMGNEANGINQSLIDQADHLVTIPKVGEAESLNVAMATGILCDSILRCNT